MVRALHDFFNKGDKIFLVKDLLGALHGFFNKGDKTFLVKASVKQLLFYMEPDNGARRPIWPEQTGFRGQWWQRKSKKKQWRENIVDQKHRPQESPWSCYLRD